jgi:uncharacterized membrane protein YqjE
MEVQQLLLMMIPVFILQLLLIVLAIRVIVLVKETKYMPKWAWVLVVLGINLFGAIACLLVHKDSERA